MDKNQLEKISNMSKLSEHSIEDILLNLGLYESVLIDTRPVRVVDNPNQNDCPYEFAVSEDVKRLHELMNNNGPFKLPCQECRETQPFKGNGYYNPRQPHLLNPEKRVKIPIAKTSQQINVFSLPKNGDEVSVYPPAEPIYNIGCNYLADCNPDTFTSYDIEEYKEEAARVCHYSIAKLLPEFRRDFICTYDESHRLFVDYIIFPAVNESDKPKKLLEYEEAKLKAGAQGVAIPEMSTDVKELYKLYKDVSYCLVLKKVSMYPSQADLQFFETRKYQKILRDKYKDYTTAIGLYACGIGSGSFVYLRRIFENLAEEHHKQCQNIAGWNEEEYSKKRFNEKLEYMEQFGQKLIPDELSSVREKLYGVLSKGVHELPDEDCKELFPAVQYAIEMILDKRVEESEKQKKTDEMLKRIAAVKAK